MLCQANEGKVFHATRDCYAIIWKENHSHLFDQLQVHITITFDDEELH